MTNAREASTHLAALLRNERGFLADFLLALADFDRNAQWRELGYPSLFLYLHEGLKLSKSASQTRKTAAGLIQAFPEVARAIRSGELCLSTVNDVAHVLTGENARDVLPRFFGLSHREAEVIAAALRPAEVVPTRDLVTPVRTACPAPTQPTASGLFTREVEGAESARSTVGAAATAVPTSELNSPVRVGPPAQLPSNPTSNPVPTSELNSPVRVSPTAQALYPRSALRREAVEPLGADAFRVHVTVSRRFVDKLEAARDALGHAVPDGNHADILERGLDLVLAEAAKKHGLVEKPQPKVRPAKREHVPAHVKREVWQRAGGRCECTLPTGERCEETLRLEYDHVPPLALGGVSTVENVRIACRAHNHLAARQALGDELMDRYARSKAPPRDAHSAAIGEDAALALFGRAPDAREPVAAYAGSA